MTKCNFISLTSGCGTQSCRWMDNCGCSDGCSTCGSGCGSCLNGCSSGCLNGCSTCGTCANSCGSCAQGCGYGCCGGGFGCNSSSCSGCNDRSGSCNWNCNSGCGWWNGCGWDSCWSCSSLWPDAPALPSGGTLVPRIIGTGRLCQRVNDVTLCVGDIPDSAQKPYALLSVSASGPSDWEFIAVERWRAVLRVNIPLTAQIRDCAGCVYTGHSSITVEVPVRITIPTSDLGRAHVTVTPGVRLLCIKGCSEDGCFTVALAVLVDVYVARWEPSSDGVTIPCRPDLPLTLPLSFQRSC